MKKRRSRIAPAVLCCVVLAACGDDDKDQGQDAVGADTTPIADTLIADTSEPDDSAGQDALEADTSNRPAIRVDNVSDLMANIGRSGVSIELAPGLYVIPACGGGVDEVDDDSCGQMRQGDDAELWSHLDLAQDADGVPLATGEELEAGAVIDCSALPPSGLALSCLVGGDGSVIRNLTIRNGSQIPDPDPPGGTPNHRNAIMVAAGTDVQVEEVRLQNARRGVVLTCASDTATRGVVRHSLIEGTELAGVFVWSVAPDFSGVTGSTLHGEAHANRLSHVGRHPLLLEFAFFGTGNVSHAAFVDNIVDDTNIFGVTVNGGGSANDPSTQNTATFLVEGGRLEGRTGLLLEGWSPDGSHDNDGNCVAGEVKGVTFDNNETAIDVWVAGWGENNRYLVAMTDSTSVGESQGRVRVVDDADSAFRFAGTTATLQASNTGFDVSDLNATHFDANATASGYCDGS